MLDLIGPIGLLLILSILLIWLVFIVPRDMALARNRNPVIWVIVAVVGSPILAVALLLALGVYRPPDI